MYKNIKSHVTKDITFELTGNSIIKLLKDSNLVSKNADLTISFNIPAAKPIDQANTTIEINDDNTIKVRSIEQFDAK